MFCISYRIFVITRWNDTNEKLHYKCNIITNVNNYKCNVRSWGTFSNCLNFVQDLKLQAMFWCQWAQDFICRGVIFQAFGEVLTYDLAFGGQYQFLSWWPISENTCLHSRAAASREVHSIFNFSPLKDITSRECFPSPSHTLIHTFMNAFTIVHWGITQRCPHVYHTGSVS